jgi:hypothetical protein
MPFMSADQAEGPLQHHAGPPAPPSFDRLRRNLLLDVALPWITVQILERYGIPAIPALAAAAAFPLASILVSWRRQRRADIIGISVIITILGGITVSILSDDVRFALVKAAPAFALFGLACLLSLPAARPLMFFVSRSVVAGGDPVKIAEWNARVATPSFRRTMRWITAVWGVAALAEATLGITAALLLPVSAALIVEPLLAIGTVLALLAWTRAFARVRRARAAAEPASGPSHIQGSNR